MIASRKIMLSLSPYYPVRPQKPSVIIITSAKPNLTKNRPTEGDITSFSVIIAATIKITQRHLAPKTYPDFLAILSRSHLSTAGYK